MSELTVAVAIASLGRPAELAGALEALLAQSRQADRIILSVTTPDDLPKDAPFEPPHVERIIGPRGSCVQRNAALDRLGASTDIVAFWDDDYVPSRFAVERIARFFAANPDVVGASGKLLADGATGAMIAADEARRLLDEHDAEPAAPPVVFRDLDGLYGCNMAFRTSAVESIRFDERLPLYGWQEDIDFSARASAHGRIVRTLSFAGVHLGVRHGRSPGVRVGYSQVVNPIYLARKGTMRPRYAAKLVARNVLANHAHLLRPEPWIDRAGRARGNWLGLIDVVRGRITPERIVRL